VGNKEGISPSPADYLRERRELSQRGGGVRGGAPVKNEFDAF